MKRILFSLVSVAALAANAQDIVLATPELGKGTNIMQAFSERRSTREFADKELSMQDISNLLWATMGVNRPNGNLTAPSCLNKQEIRLFAFTQASAYEYMPDKHTLRHVADGDYRHLVAGGQEFVNSAPLCLVMIADMDKFGSTDARSMTMVAIDAGIVSENVCVAAAGLGLATVPRATMDNDGIKKVLGLNERQIPLMNNPVGYFK